MGSPVNVIKFSSSNLDSVVVLRKVRQGDWVSPQFSFEGKSPLAFNPRLGFTTCMAGHYLPVTRDNRVLKREDIEGIKPEDIAGFRFKLDKMSFVRERPHYLFRSFPVDITGDGSKDLNIEVIGMYNPEASSCKGPRGPYLSNMSMCPLEWFVYWTAHAVAEGGIKAYFNGPNYTEEGKPANFGSLGYTTDCYGFRVSVGDFNGDGLRDFAIASNVELELFDPKFIYSLLYYQMKKMSHSFQCRKPVRDPLRQIGIVRDV